MEIPKEIGSKYRFIVLAGLRVAQLQKGAVPKVDLGKGAKMTAIAIHEIMQEKLSFHQIDSQEQAELESSQTQETKPLES